MKGKQKKKKQKERRQGVSTRHKEREPAGQKRRDTNTGKMYGKGTVPCGDTKNEKNVVSSHPRVSTGRSLILGRTREGGQLIIHEKQEHRERGGGRIPTKNREGKRC